MRLFSTSDDEVLLLVVQIEQFLNECWNEVHEFYCSGHSQYIFSVD